MIINFFILFFSDRVDTKMKRARDRWMVHLFIGWYITLFLDTFARIKLTKKYFIILMIAFNIF